MAQFVQVGDRAFNMDHVAQVEFKKELKMGARLEYTVTLYTSAGDYITTLCGADHDVFRQWWDNHAEVYVCL